MKFLVISLFVFCSVFSHAEKFLPAETAQSWMKSEGAILLDVREKSELKSEGLAKGSTWIPMSEISRKSKRWMKFQNQLTKNKKVIIYCASGGRASRVELTLKSKGIQAYNMGGFDNWKKIGLPVATFQ